MERKNKKRRKKRKGKRPTKNVARNRRSIRGLVNLLEKASIVGIWFILSYLIIYYSKFINSFVMVFLSIIPSICLSACHPDLWLNGSLCGHAPWRSWTWFKGSWAEPWSVLAATCQGLCVGSFARLPGLSIQPHLHVVCEGIGKAYLHWPISPCHNGILNQVQTNLPKMHRM